MGRPSKYNKKLADNIMSRFAGGELLKDILKPVSMPSRWSIYRWCALDAVFKAQYNKASECFADSIVEDSFKGVMSGDKSNAKLLDVQFKASSFIASRINRSKWGEKLDITHNVTADISPALSLAVDRMRSIGTGLPPLIEAKTG